MPELARDKTASFMRMIDGLLKKLPGADPELKGDRARVKVSSVPEVGHAPRGPAPVTTSEKLSVWARVLLGAVLGGVVNQWPYGRDCGAGLAFYVLAVFA